MSAKYTFLAWETSIVNAPLKLALLQLANNANDNGFSYYSISKMATACGMSDRTFMRKIADLETMGVLTVERRSNRPSIYALIGDEMGVTLCHLQNSEVTESHPEVTESHLVGDRESHDPNITPNTSLVSKDLLSEKKNSDSLTVLTYLNEVFGTNYKKTTKSHIENINGRLSDGHTIEDCKLVIDSKFADWGNDSKMVTYLRPQTLFNAGKFQGYLMAAKSKPVNKTSLHNIKNIDYGQSGSF